MNNDLISRQQAIDALDCINGVEEVLRSLPSVQPERTEKRTETHACDLISRQAALEKVRTMQTYKLFEGDDMILVDKADVQTELMMLPSVQPELKEGYWIGGNGSYICSECNSSPLDFIETMGLSFDIYVETLMNYCPNCGAKMKGGAG